MIEIRSLSPEATYPLRIKILRNGIADNYKFDGDLDKTTFHLGAFEREECIGIASFVKNTNPLVKGKNTYQLRGMAVEVEQQRKGVGQLLLQSACKLLKDADTSVLWCNAREVAVDFYKKQGFVVISAKFEIPNIGAHYVMSYNIGG